MGNTKFSNVRMRLRGSVDGSNNKVLTNDLTHFEYYVFHLWTSEQKQTGLLRNINYIIHILVGVN